LAVWPPFPVREGLEPRLARTLQPIRRARPTASDMPASDHDKTDLAVAIVSYNDARWLTPCLSSIFEHAGSARLDVIVIDNGSDGAHELVASQFPNVRTLTTENHGFGGGNNVALMTSSSRYALFLNPDTQIVD